MGHESDCDTEFCCNGSAAALAQREVDQEVAARLVALEALDPSQKRPTPNANIRNRVDFMEWETYHDIGVRPFHQQKSLGFVHFYW
jgi:hypothetical protein